MTKTATDARRCVLPALAASAGLSAMLFASRLPVTLDFILPRRAGWPLFVLGFSALSRGGPRRVYAMVATLLVLGALGRLIHLVAKPGVRSWTYRAAAALASAVLLAWWSFTVWLEVSQKVWFPYGSMNALEPAASLLFFFALAYAAMRAALAYRAPRPPSLKPLLAWGAVNAAAAALAAFAYGSWAAAPAPAVEGRRLFVVLTEEEGRPGQAAYDMPIARPPAGPVPRARRLEALRALYEARAKLMDPQGLRSALMLGVKNEDALARSLLLEHLSAAPPSPSALGALGALADETAHRIGPLGAARIALAYAHLGDAAQAALWAKRGEAGPRGVPAGLLDLAGGGALKPGRVAGRLAGVMPMKVALYRKRDPGAPYLLDAAGLVASAEPDARGRFSFSGLPAGRYYLAFAFPGTAEGEIRVAGHRGDLVLSERRAQVDLPTLTFKPR